MALARIVQRAQSPDFRNYVMSTHFWGPLANWGFVIAALADSRRPPAHVSGPMTVSMCIYSALFMRFALMIQPRNLLLFACHLSNETAQLYQLSRKVRYEIGKRAAAAKPTI